jgi:histidinol dehydrogenase
MVSKIIKKIIWNDASQEEKNWILNRSQLDLSSARQVAEEWMDKIAHQGDDALVEYVRKFDNPDFTKNDIRVTRADIKEAYAAVPKETVDIIHKQVAISREFHERQLPEDKLYMREYIKGVNTGWKYSPIESAGLAIPAGQVPLPTVMQILGVAAKTAKVPRVVACFPPTGKHYEMLIAADIVNIDEIYRVGGIAGIGAMSIGTETISKVLKIVGPGSIYTQAAKVVASLRGTAIDMLSGPSETLIIADSTARPEYCAADIIACCEHDQNACSVLVTTCEDLVERTIEEISKQLASIGRKDVAEVALGRYSAIVLLDNMAEVIEFANDYGAEHLEIITEDPWKVCAEIHNAGSILIGENSPGAIGDYASGTNNCLPTGIASKTVSPIGIDTFLKKSEIQHLTKDGLKALAPIVSTISAIEKLDGHNRSVQIRLQE